MTTEATNPADADVRRGSSKGPRQRPYTVEVEYLLPVYKTVQVTAGSVKEACEKALATVDWHGSTEDYDSASAEYVTGILTGHHDNIHEGGGVHRKVPSLFGRKVALKDDGRFRR